MSKTNTVKRKNSKPLATPSSAQSSLPHSRRWLKRLVAGFLLFIVFVVLALGAIGWYYSDQLLHVGPLAPAESMLVTHVTAKTVTLQVTASSKTQGVYGLDWAKGHAVIGNIIASNATTVTRQLISQTEPLTVGLRVSWNVDVYSGTPATMLGLHYTDVGVPDPLGVMPAWYLPGRLHTWVVMVHGYKEARSEGLRYLPTLTQQGFPVLDLTFRNDKGAPSSPDGIYHLGDTEWRDVEAGVQYALGHGASNVVLYGISMGGGLVETFLHRSSYATHVQAAILDSPVLDWRSVLVLQGDERHLPGFLTSVATQVISWRANIDFDALDQVRLSSSMTTPTLLFQGTSDTTVPASTADAFAHVRPDLVTYHRLKGGFHTQAWNRDPKAYDAELVAFLTSTIHA